MQVTDTYSIYAAELQIKKNELLALNDLNTAVGTLQLNALRNRKGRWRCGGGGGGGLREEKIAWRGHECLGAYIAN
jgi:hypothetical protein